jgi:hypothetical protein
LPTSGKRWYTINTYLHAYNNITSYQRNVTISCSDASGNTTQSTVALTATGNEPPDLMMYGVLDVSYTPRANMNTGVPIIRPTPYVTDLFMYDSSMQDHVNSGMAGVNSLGLYTDVMDNSYDLTKEVFDVTVQAPDGSYSTANNSDYMLQLRSFGSGGGINGTTNQQLSMSTPGVVTVTQIVADSQNIYGAGKNRWITTSNILFGKSGTYKIGFTAYDSTLDKGSFGISSDMHTTINVKCPPSYIQTGTTCRNPNRTVTIFEHGSDTGANVGNGTLYDVGGGANILGYSNKTSATSNGPTLTLELGKSILTSARFSSEDSVDQFVMYIDVPKVTGGTTRNFFSSKGGAAWWVYTFPTPNQSGWWLLKTTTPVSNLPSFKRSITSTPVQYVDEYGFTTTFISFATTNDTGQLIQDRPETNITDSSQTSGVKNIPFTPTVLGLHKVCAAATRYAGVGPGFTESCYFLQVVCPAGTVQSGSSCVASGPPAFTSSAYIRAKVSDSTIKVTSGAQATTTDGSFYDWSYSISGQSPASCTMQQRNDGGAWAPIPGYASDPQTYTLAWSTLTQQEKTDFITGFTLSHEWNLTCADAVGRTSSLIWKLIKDQNPPVVMSANMNNSCQTQPPVPSLSVSCMDADYIEVTNQTTGAVVGSANQISATIPIPSPGIYVANCRSGGANGIISTTPLIRTYDPSVCNTAIQSFIAAPKTIKAGSSVVIQWDILKPSGLCTLTATASCVGTCSQQKIQEAALISGKLQNENTDVNDPDGAGRPMPTALSQNVITDGSTPRARGKKSIKVNYTTDFLLTCGTVDKKVRVQVSNDKEG